MNIQIVMNGSGDTRHEFDVADAKALRRAEARFRELTGRGFRAVALGENGEPNALMREFEPQVKRSLFVPQLEGG